MPNLPSERKSLIYFFITSTVVFSLSSLAHTATVSPGLQALLQNSTPEQHISILVTLSGRADLSVPGHLDRGARRARVISALKEKAERAQGPIIAFLRQRGVKRIKPFWIFNGMAVTAGAGVIQELAALPGVESVALDSVIHPPETGYQAVAEPEWNLAAVRAPGLWAVGFTGQGVVVANMDTGVDMEHPDLMSRWRGGSNSWFDPNGEHAMPYDADGHGTQTMGVIVGGDAGGTSIGMAPGAQWIAVKIFDDAGDAFFSDIHSGFQWLLDPDGNPGTDDAPDVVNNSWGIDEPSHICDTTFEEDILALSASEISVVFSAGNFGPGPSTSLSPADNAGAFPVGAVDSELTVAHFSSRGPSACDGGIFPSVVAPGVAIRSSDLTLGGVFPNSYASVSGTSFSAPHVAGALALLLSAFPDATVLEMEDALKNSADDKGEPGADNDYGHGVLDVLGAHAQVTVPDIAVTDSVAPAGDLQVPFGDLSVGATEEQTVTVTNNGNADLTLGSVGVADPLADPFGISGDICSGQTLAPSASCTLKVLFSPALASSYNDSFDIPSNDPDENPVTVRLNGNGLSLVSNNPPDVPELVFPANRQDGLGTTLEFRWKKSRDPDGDEVTYSLLICEDAGFTSGCKSLIGVVSIEKRGFFHASTGSGLLLLFGMAFAGAKSRRSSCLILLAMAITGLLLVSCGNHNSISTPMPTTGSEVTQEVTGLEAGTTYYWKVIADDGNGGSSESVTRTFTTQ